MSEAPNDQPPAEPPKKAQRPFRRNVKPKDMSKVAEKMEVIKKTFDASRAGAGAKDNANLALANFSDALQAKISLPEALDVLVAQLGATKKVFDLNANEMVTMEDGATRQKALELYFHYLLGKPIERKIIEHHDIDSMDDLKAKLATNPALCDSLAKMLAEAKGQQGSTP